MKTERQDSDRREQSGGFHIRTAELKDIGAINGIDAACFDALAASDDALVRGRISCYADHFWVLCDGERVVGYLDGFSTGRADLEDEMLTHPEQHEEDGAWQMLFGLAVDPAYQGRGCASMLLRHAESEARRQGRSGLVLTCRERLVPFYRKLGFRDEGISAHALADGPWHQMRLLLN